MDRTPKISVVIPIRNEERFIARTIGYIREQDYPADKVEILVVDGESDDCSAEIVAEIARQDSRVKLLTSSRRLSSAGRNVGIGHAEGEVITFIDGHTCIDNDQLLRNVATLLVEKDLRVLSRPQFLDTPDNNRFQQAVSLARKSPLGHGLDSTIYCDEDKYVDPGSSGATYCREVFDLVGRYDERFDACEDVEFNTRVAKAGMQSFTSMRLAVYYYPRESLGQLFRQMMRYGVGRFRLARKHPDTLSPGTLIPFLFVIGLPLLAVLALICPIVWYFLLVGVAGYLLLAGAASLTISIRHGWRYLPLLVPIFPVIHVGLGWGFLLEMIRTVFGRGPDFSADAVTRDKEKQ